MPILSKRVWYNGLKYLWSRIENFHILNNFNRFLNRFIPIKGGPVNKGLCFILNIQNFFIFLPRTENQAFDLVFVMEKTAKHWLSWLPVTQKLRKTVLKKFKLSDRKRNSTFHYFFLHFAIIIRNRFFQRDTFTRLFCTIWFYVKDPLHFETGAGWHVFVNLVTLW